MRFWELVATLGGVATGETCERLGDVLRSTGETEAFHVTLSEKVRVIVTTCRMSGDRGGDTGEWLAAAVVAAGPAAYDSVLVSGAVQEDDWTWGDAESLLVVGVDPAESAVGAGPGDHGAAEPPLDVTLQWYASPAPVGVEVPPDIVDAGDDPSYGSVPVHDPDWVTAREQLAADPGVVARRIAAADLELGLTVRPAATSAPPATVFDPQPVAEASVQVFAGDPRHRVVLVLPVTDFPESGSRVGAYVAAVHRLLDAAEDVAARNR